VNKLSQEQFPSSFAELENGISKAKNDLENIEAKLKKIWSEKSSFEEQISKAMNPGNKAGRLNSIKTNENMMLCMLR
jgi:flagellar biosynthesis chaperone FliJ